MYDASNVGNSGRYRVCARLYSSAEEQRSTKPYAQVRFLLGALCLRRLTDKPRDYESLIVGSNPAGGTLLTLPVVE